jgi:hypothetical protein
LCKAAQFNMTKAHARQPDWMTFNGYSGQYVMHPLTANPGENVRFYVVDAGPSIDTDFHIVGTILKRAWVDAGVTSTPLRNVQTVAFRLVAAGSSTSRSTSRACTRSCRTRSPRSIRASSAC